MRELDLILERYLKQYVEPEADNVSTNHTDAFSSFLDHTDMDIYSWLTGRGEPSLEVDAEIVMRLRRLQD